MTLERYDNTPTRCIGRIRMAAEIRTWTTLEDTVREAGAAKVYGKTAIPAGMYRVIITHSPKFGRQMPLLVDVPGYEAIRIHPGNTEVDTEGCILVGTTRTADAISNSRTAFGELFPLIEEAVRGAGCWIEVRDTFRARAGASEVH